MRPQVTVYKAVVIVTADSKRAYVGRFAPSPSGALHFGSLVAAVGSYARARSSGGAWLLRVEDLDPPREKPGAAEEQIDTLRRFGLIPDRPVERQSQHRARHEQVLCRLLAMGKAFHCGCSRRDLPADGVYPGTCRAGLAKGRRSRAIRFWVGSESVEFVDALQGPQRQVPAEQCGDFVIRRADGLIAYQLAVVVDDAAAGVSEIVRGCDLLESSGRQILLRAALDLPQPEHLHLPLVVDASGRKLSKSAGDDPIRRYSPHQALRLALRALGHEPPAAKRTIEAQWAWLFDHWDIGRIPRGPIAVDVQDHKSEVYTPTLNATTSL